jgi:hypothetical protein
MSDHTRREGYAFGAVGSRCRRLVSRVIGSNRTLPPSPLKWYGVAWRSHTGRIKVGSREDSMIACCVGVRWQYRLAEHPYPVRSLAIVGPLCLYVETH